MDRSSVRTPSRRTLLACVVAAVLGLAAAGHAHAADKRVVAVLYFDNNTGDAEFDVLRKGFADMLITDLAGVEEIVVVERDKLEKLLDEIKLQRGSYFDKRTAVKVGKGLGAKYAVTGAFVAVKPSLRIDVRMIDIATGQVVVASKVTGKASELFDLEQQLVARFVDGLKVKFEPPAKPATRVPNVATLVKYSEGIDLADRGKLQEASERMAQVVRAAPTFALARVRRDEILRKLKAASERRQDIISESGVELGRNAEDFLKRNELAKLDKEQAKAYLAYRIVRGRFILRTLRGHVSGANVNVIKRGEEKKALAQMKAYYANQQLLAAELAAYAKQHTATYPNGVTYLDTSFKLPPDDERRAAQAGMGASLSADDGQIKHQLAQFLLLGHADDGGQSRLTVGPTLSDLEPKFAKIGYKLLDEAWAAADAKLAQSPHLEWFATSALETYAEALLLRDKQEQGIAKLQEILDRYPTSGRFPYVERRIKQELGLEHEHSVRERERWAKGLKGCGDMDLRVGLDTLFYRRTRVMGLAGVRATVAEAEKACQGKPSARQFWAYLYKSAALEGGKHDDCPFFDEFMARSLQAGGSASDAAGYRKNYTRCP